MKRLPILLIVLLSFFVAEGGLPKSKSLKFLFLGDSYTIGEGVDLLDNYPYQLKKRLESQGYKVAKPMILAETGYTTGKLMATIRSAQSLINKDTFDYVFILIGVNNQYKERTLEEYSFHLQEIIKSAKLVTNKDVSKIIFLSIPDYSYTPFTKKMDRPKIFKEIKEFNGVLKDVADFNKIPIVDVHSFSKDIVKDKSLLAKDGLHYSTKMYSKWIDLLLPYLVGTVEKKK